MNRHLNVFEPYRELPAGHEDQLTRAAMIICRLVPLAREALLSLIAEQSQSALPECGVDMQTSRLSGGAQRAADSDAELHRLVSVFLTPDLEEPTATGEVQEIDRGQRLDGVLRFEPDLVIAIESKVYEGRSNEQARTLNLHGLRFAETAVREVRWHALLERWWRLMQVGVLSPVEGTLIQDLFDFADRDFGHLLPFNTLRLAADDPTRRARRLRTILMEATGLKPEDSAQVHVRLDNAVGAVAIQRVALDEEEEGVVAVRIWPGELKPQAAHLYDAARADRLIELAREGEGWEILPWPHLAYRTSRRGDRLYMTCGMPVDEYVRRLEGPDWDEVGAHAADELRDRFWPWLVKAGYAADEDTPQLAEFLQRLGRRDAHFRPGIRVSRKWSREQAEALDDEAQLAPAIRVAIAQMLGALDEPGLPG
jgi:hypothetical protein